MLVAPYARSVLRIAYHTRSTTHSVSTATHTARVAHMLGQYRASHSPPHSQIAQHAIVRVQMRTVLASLVYLVAPYAVSVPDIA
eukprot:1262047-Rhodomonas_salina.3